MTKPTGADLFRAMTQYIGTPYEYGGWDCSEAILQACKDVGVEFVDGSTAQKNATTEILLESAPIGALGWRQGHDGLLDGAGGILHAANEARGTVWDTSHKPLRLTYAGLIPGIDYSTPEVRTMVDLVWPVPSKRITSDYDLKRRLPLGPGGKMIASPHAGIDIRAPKGTNVKSPVNGTIVAIVSNRTKGLSSSYGDVLAPGRSGNGFKIRYGNRLVLLGHVKPYSKWRVGQTVRVGDDLGAVDESGTILGAHLHMEDWSNWQNHKSHTNFSARLTSKGSGTGTAPTPEEDDMTPDERKELFYQGDQLRAIADLIVSQTRAVPDAVWNRTVRRGSQPEDQIRAIQELADAKSLLLAAAQRDAIRDAKLDALTEIVKATNNGGIDVDALLARVEKSAEQGVGNALQSIKTTVSLDVD